MRYADIFSALTKKQQLLVKQTTFFVRPILRYLTTSLRKQNYINAKINSQLTLAMYRQSKFISSHAWQTYIPVCYSVWVAGRTPGP